MISLYKMSGFVFLIASLFSCQALKKTQIQSQESIPFHPLNTEKDLDVLIKEIGNDRVVLLGESTHGTHEFYEWRAAITKRLIAEKGFQIIGIEGDWTDTYRVNEFIQGPGQNMSAAEEVLKQYDRWPASMWGNYEMADLIEWLNRYNQIKDGKKKIGIYGLDLFSFWEWANQPLPSGDSVLKDLVRQFRQRFDSFQNDAIRYTAAVKRDSINNSQPASHLWNYVKKINDGLSPENIFLIQQQASLAYEGERYFRTLATDKVQSWNIRENYMASSIIRLLDFYGKDSKVIIWVHNGHAGDAAFSQMAESGYISIGQLLKKQLGNKIFSVAFGSNSGAVYAGYYWDAPLMEIKVPAAREGSWENILHVLNNENKVILSREIKNNKQFNQWLPFRSIGAAYSAAIYGTAIIPKRYDALIFIDSTTAIHPLKKDIRNQK